MTHLKIVNGSV